MQDALSSRLEIVRKRWGDGLIQPFGTKETLEQAVSGLGTSSMATVIGKSCPRAASWTDFLRKILATLRQERPCGSLESNPDGWLS